MKKSENLISLSEDLQNQQMAKLAQTVSTFVDFHWHDSEFQQLLPFIKNYDDIKKSLIDSQEKTDRHQRIQILGALNAIAALTGYGITSEQFFLPVVVAAGSIFLFEIKNTFSKLGKSFKLLHKEQSERRALLATLRNFGLKPKHFESSDFATLSYLVDEVNSRLTAEARQLENRLSDPNADYSVGDDGEIVWIVDEAYSANSSTSYSA